MAEADEARTAQVSAIAALDEPARRQLYDYVVRQPAPVSRDEAAEAMRAPRTTVAFHLDRLVSEGLLEVVFERRTGRSGPGAGRPSKLYRRSANHIAVSLPDRRYELAAHLLTDALGEADASGESPRAVLNRRARELGHRLGTQARPTHPGDTNDDTNDDVAVTMRALEALGFEPRLTDGTIVLGNCPFHSLAGHQPELVCGMNLCLLDGLLTGLAAASLTPRLAPAPRPGPCCVRLQPTPRG